jgi:hypothetical protein
MGEQNNGKFEKICASHLGVIQAYVLETTNTSIYGSPIAD